MGRVRIKVCCIASVDEVRTAVEHGADAVGLVSAMPSGPGVISDEAIAAAARAVPPGVGSFLLTSKTAAAPLIAQIRAAGVNTVQLVDAVGEQVLSELRASLPAVRIVQVIHVTGEESLAEAVSVAPRVDAVLLDSGNPKLTVKELGGTGRVHDWAISRRIHEAVGALPVFLAGGLREENVARAIEQVRPFGVDVCSGVRTAGRLDPVKLAAFVKAIGA